MRRLAVVPVLLATVALAGSAALTTAEAGPKKKPRKTTAVVMRQNTGGYSYTYNDAVVEFRDRSVLRDPNLDAQGGPFDSGYFFDSNVTAYGSDAPYLN